MKKVYSLRKEIIFKNNIYDILSIAIDKKFSLDGYAVKGQFLISGEYLIREHEKDVFDIDLPYLNYIEDNYDVSKIRVDIDDFYYEIKDSNKLVINIDIVVDGLVEKEIRDLEDEMIVIDGEEEKDAVIEKVDEGVRSTKELEDEMIEEISRLEEELEEEFVNNNEEKEEIVEVMNEIGDINMEKEELCEKKVITHIDDNGKIEKERDMLEENKDNSSSLFEDSSRKEFVTYKVCIVRDGDTIESIMEKYNVTLDSIKKYNIINDLKIGDKVIIPYERN